MSVTARKIGSVCGWSPFQECSRNNSPKKVISIYEVTNMPTIIREFSINYETTTPKSCHDVTTPMET
mgnify:CR=1 FL=1